MTKSLFFAVLCLISTPALSGDVVVALSPFQSQSKAAVQALMQDLSALEPGTKAIMVDAYHLKIISEFEVPETAQSPRQILKRNSKTIAALMQLFTKNEVDFPQIIHAVKLPQALSFIARNFAPSDIVVLGSPKYYVPGEHLFSMYEGHVPSDGHINAPAALSPFGTADKQSALSGKRIHFALTEGTGYASTQHRHFLERFWTLFVEAQGGVMVSYLEDKRTVFARLRGQAAPPPHTHQLSTATKREMHRFRTHRLRTPIFERDIADTPLSLRTFHRASEVELGISWDCTDCDLDVYARPWPGAALIYFGAKRTAQGHHLKDFTRSPKLENAFETISFDVPLDLAHLQVGIVFYAGKSPQGVKGELRLSTGGQTFARDFHITASTGAHQVILPGGFDAPDKLGETMLMLRAGDIAARDTH